MVPQRADYSHQCTVAFGCQVLVTGSHCFLYEPWVTSGLTLAMSPYLLPALPPSKLTDPVFVFV